MRRIGLLLAIVIYLNVLAWVTFFVQQAAVNARTQTAQAQTSGVAPGKAQPKLVGNITGDATKGKTVFGGTCAACHGPAAKGVTGLGKDLTTSAFVKGQTNNQLVAFIKQGRPTSDPANTTKIDMPPKGGNPALSDKDLADVVAYMRSLQN